MTTLHDRQVCTVCGGTLIHATPPSGEATDPDSPQWEACRVCGGDHWTRDHGIGTRRYSATPPSEEATPLEQVLMQHEEHLWGCVICGVRVRPPSEEATGLDALVREYVAAEDEVRIPAPSRAQWDRVLAARQALREHARLTASDGGRE